MPKIMKVDEIARNQINEAAKLNPQVKLSFRYNTSPEKMKEYLSNLLSAFGDYAISFIETSRGSYHNLNGYEYSWHPSKGVSTDRIRKNDMIDIIIDEGNVTIYFN